MKKILTKSKQRIMKIKNDKKLNGCYVLERGTTTIAKSIIKHNNLYAKILGKEPTIFSHAEFLLWSDKDQIITIRGKEILLLANTLYTIGARGEGTNITRAVDYYQHHEIQVFEPLVPLSKKETEDCWLYFYMIKDNKYQYGSLLAWIHLIKVTAIEVSFGVKKLPGKWIAKQGDKRNVCYELCARFCRIAERISPEVDLDYASIFDLIENLYYRAKR